MSELISVFQPDQTALLPAQKDEVEMLCNALAVSETKDGDHSRNKAMQSLIKRTFQAGFTVKDQMIIDKGRKVELTSRFITRDSVRSIVVLRDDRVTWDVILTREQEKENDDPLKAKVSLKIESGNAKACFPVDPVVTLYRGKSWDVQKGVTDTGKVTADYVEEFGPGERMSGKISKDETDRLLQHLSQLPVDEEATKKYFHSMRRVIPGAQVYWNQPQAPALNSTI